MQHESTQGFLCRGLSFIFEKIFQEQRSKPLSEVFMLNLYFHVIPHLALPENTVTSDDMLPLAHLTPVVRELYHDTSFTSDG